MATVLQPIVNELNTVLVQLRTELRGLQTDADGAGIAIVMGPAGNAGKQSTADLQHKIKADALLGSLAIEQSNMSAARRNVRRLMEDYSEQVAQAAIAESSSLTATTYLHPIQSRAQAMIAALDSLDAKVKALVSATTRIPGAGKMSAARKQSIDDYEESQRLVVDVARKINLAEKEVQRLSELIGKLMYQPAGAPGLNVDSTKISEYQGSRDALSKEIIYLEQEVIKHFKPGTMTRRADARPTVTPFQFPTDIESGKGKEFGTGTMIAMLSCVNEFWMVIPACRRAISDFNPITGTYFKPPSKDDGYSDVEADGREMYAQQAQNLWDRLEKVIPASVITKVKSTFAVGKKEVEFSCPEGDGPSLIFSIIALYRPSGDAYRQDVETMIYASSQKLGNGSNPANWIEEIRPLIQEALALDIKLKWSMSGKKIVPLMTERSNTFGQKLSKFANGASVVDQDDCAVELDQVVSLIETGCKDLNGAGMKVVVKANQIQIDYGNAKDCPFGMDCFRKSCGQRHPPGFVSKYDPNKGGKGGSGGKGGKGKGKSGSKGKGKGGDKTCEAKGCPASSPYHALCKSCHRKGLEGPGYVMNKWGQKIEVGKKDLSRSEKKAFKAFKEDKKKREREEFEDAGSHKRASSAIFERLGDRGPVSAKLKRANQAVIEAQSEANEAERQELMRRLQEIDYE